MQTRHGHGRLWLMLAGGALTLAMAEPPPPVAVTTETKIRLMAAALRARDAGEFAVARQQAEALHELLPNDANVRRLLAEIDKLDTMHAGGAVAETPAAARPRTEPTPGPMSPEVEAEALAQEEARRIAALVAAAPGQCEEARRLAAGGRTQEALALVDRAVTALPLNPLTRSALRSLEETKASLVAVPAGKPAALPPAAEPAADERAERARQMVKGRSQYLAGDLAAARETLRAVEAREPGREEAKRFLARIEQEIAEADERTRVRTGAQMMEDVNRSWRRPAEYHGYAPGQDAAEAAGPLARKLDEIVLPTVSFTRVEIGQVVAALGAIAEEFDTTGVVPKGVNVVLLDPANKAPKVTLTLHHTPLRRVLDFVAESIGYQYEVQADAVVLRPGGDGSVLDTRFFAVTRATVLRMTGVGAVANTAPAKPAGFSLAGASSEATATPGGEGGAVKAFLQQAGVNFDTVPGSNLAYDGSALIVTQTPRNLERIRNILTRYNDVRQVEIEAKFMEVQQGALEELGVNWTITQKATQHSGADATYRTNGRSLAAAFGSTTGNAQGRIVRPESAVETADGGTAVTTPLDLPIVNNAPRMPGAAELGAAAVPFASISGVVGEFDVTAVVRALSQKQGTDLLSAPKVTVLSGNPANITVAQEMRYPRSFGQTQSQVGTGNASGGGSAGVAITAGTPQDFTARNVGVELKVTPTVEEDDYSISLDLNPKVTEFDGFVEYGGSSIAISGSTTVTVPSGFYQPIFSVRDISTKVTIWDGATLVMGGLTREEVKTVNDKVPILGDIPILGRAFRSKGESAQKRNLLIFVTANLVNPGGAPKQQRLRRETARAVRANSSAVENVERDAARRGLAAGGER